MPDETHFTPRSRNGRFQRALILENPDPILDDQLRALGMQEVRPVLREWLADA